MWLAVRANMNRRRFISAVGAIGLGAVAGCLHQPGRYGGWIIALGAVDRPDDVDPVPRSDDRIADVEPIQAAIDDIGEDIRVSRQEYRELASILEELPYYEPETRETGSGIPGYYIVDDTVDYWPVLWLQPECAESVTSTIIDTGDENHAPHSCWYPD